MESNSPIKIHTIISTSDSQEVLENMAKSLVESGLIACANILPNISSIYRWQGETVNSKECIIMLKVLAKNVDKTCEQVKKLHNYETPLIAVYAPEKINLDYLNWMEESSGKTE